MKRLFKHFTFGTEKSERKDKDDELGLGLSADEDGLDSGTGVSSNREDQFNLESGRFHDEETGEFEMGGPPPDYDSAVDRYRAKDGTFKSRSSDLFDEPMEAKEDDLSFDG